MTSLIVEYANLFIYLIAAAIGLSIALVTWLLSCSASEVPIENRTYKDSPPLGFRLVWWPVQWCSHVIGPFISQRMHTAIMVRLRKGGLDYSLRPAQFIAGRALCALVGAVVAVYVLAQFDPVSRGGAGFDAALYLEIAAVAAVLGWLYPAIWLRDRLALRRSELMKTLPFFLDIITLCVEGGLNMQGAIEQAVSKGPKGVLREELQRVMRDIRAGKGRATALRDMADRLNEPGVVNFAVAVIQAENMGMNLGPILRAQADQRRSERFLRAEKLAMEAPVKMLFPLIAFIFPCTFLVLFFPIVMKFLHSGF